MPEKRYDFYFSPTQFRGRRRRDQLFVNGKLYTEMVVAGSPKPEIPGDSSLVESNATADGINKYSMGWESERFLAHHKEELVSKTFVDMTPLSFKKDPDTAQP